MRLAACTQRTREAAKSGRSRTRLPVSVLPKCRLWSVGAISSDSLFPAGWMTECA